MPDSVIRVFFDQNIPFAVVTWMKKQCPGWFVEHAKTLGFEGQPDDFLFRWAQEHDCMVVTYDEDFADAHFHVFGQHHGVVRLRVWPTTVERTIDAMARLLSSVEPSDWQGSLIIIDNNKIRIRRT
jgi:predicted nuclease of predicted toxin-antitoxin system